MPWKVPATVLGYDQETGFGLVQALGRLNVPPLEMGGTLRVEGSFLRTRRSGMPRPRRAAGRRRIDARRSQNLGREDPAFRQIIRPIAHGRGQTASLDGVSASFADSRLAGDPSVGL